MKIAISIFYYLYGKAKNVKHENENISLDDQDEFFFFACF